MKLSVLEFANFTLSFDAECSRAARKGLFRRKLVIASLAWILEKGDTAILVIFVP
jgi:hypothetical protein